MMAERCRRGTDVPEYSGDDILYSRGYHCDARQRSGQVFYLVRRNGEAQYFIYPCMNENMATYTRIISIFDSTKSQSLKKNFINHCVS